MLYEGPKLVSIDGDGVHVIDESIAEKLAKKNLSASAITGLESCPGRWLIDSFVIDKVVEEVPDNPGRRGSLFHAIMEDFFAYDPDKRTHDLMKKLVKRHLNEGEFADLGKIKDAVLWLRGAINGYYNMGGNPQKVEVAQIERIKTGKDGKEYTKTESGLEIFVKGPIGNTTRPTLGFVDQVTVDSERDDGSVVVGDWKGLALDTPLPTVEGWTTMGAVKKGDEILGADGLTTKVVNKSSIHNRPCYELTFMDGSTVVADNVHLWNVRLGNNRKTKHHQSSQAKNKTINTEEMYDLWIKNDKSRHHIQIENPKPITVFEEKTLPVDPYIFGVWLGDGRNRDSEICSDVNDAEEMRSLLQRGWSGEVRIRPNKNSASSIIIGKPFPEKCSLGNDYEYNTDGNKKVCEDCRELRSNGIHPRNVGSNVCLSAILRRMEVTHNKHVPLDYLRSSVNQRIDLIRGLLDSDGYWHPERKRALFYTTTKELSDAFAELVVSLGITPTINRGENEHKGYYEVGFSPIGFNPFSLSRKAKLVNKHLENDKNKTHKKGLHRYIRSIEKVESVPTQCVEVDAENSLYLCGPLMTPTHNSGAKVKRWNPKTKSTDGFAEQRQQIIYATLLQQEGIKVSGARLIYPVGKEIVNVDLGDETLCQQVLESIEAADEKLNKMIETNTFELVPSFLCAWCPIAKICPKATIKPYDKMMAAYASQPEPEVLLQAIEML